MAFEPKQWKYDDDVTEQELNRIEQGIVEANQKADQNASALAAHLNENVQADQPHGIIVESGTWTPYYQPQYGNFGNIEYSEQSGYYYRNNKLVYLYGYISVDGTTFDKGTASGRLRIAGIPFAPAYRSLFLANRSFRWNTDEDTIGIYLAVERSGYLSVKKIVKPNFFYTGIPDEDIYVSNMLETDNTHINHLTFSVIYTI